MFYLIVGNDVKSRRELINKIQKEVGANKTVEYNDSALLASDVLGGTFFDLLGEEKELVVLHGCDTWKKAKENWGFLEKQIEDLDVVLTMNKVPAAAKKLKPSKNLTAKLPEKPWEVEKWLQGQLRTNKVKLEKSAISYLVGLGWSADQLIPELEKLRLYSLGASDEVSLEEVMALVGGTEENNFFVFLDALFSGQTRLALQQLLLEYQDGQNPVGILTRIINHYSLLLKVKENNAPTGTHPFALKKAKTQISKLPKDVHYWPRVSELLSKTEKRLKSGLASNPEQDLLITIMEISVLSSTR